ncbi:MAG: calmodulin-binding protein [Planctomycetes bacterium]|nr:calmodulin-binding protein [Planctomycetota bacterium]
MLRRATWVLSVAMLLVALGGTNLSAQEPHAYGRVWGGSYSSHDWERFYHYPYVFYPQNFWGNEYYRSAESLYFRYPPEMRIPVYNKKWHNPYPAGRAYHTGHHFVLDVF